MEMRTYVTLLLLLACITIAQSKPELPTAHGALAQQPGSTSETYSDTLRLIKALLQTEESNELGQLFAIGDDRTSDLMEACHSANDEIASAAFLVLQLLGKSGESCADSISRKHNGLVCAENIADACFHRIEEWLDRKRTANGYDCREDDDGPFTAIDDSLIYALVLDGSPRSRSALDHMAAFEKACKAEDTIIGELLEQPQSLMVAAQGKAHNLNFEPRTLENVIRTSAFFLPPEYRKDSEVEVIAHNKTGDRILLEVSYRCGRLCGRGYYVVLRKNGTAWQYAVIRMAWIS
jgi:hypothetical protein